MKAGASSNGHPVDVALDAVGGSRLGDFASVLSDGGAIVNFGLLGGVIPNIKAATHREISIQGARRSSDKSRQCRRQHYHNRAQA